MEKQTVKFPLAVEEYLKGKDLVEIVDNHRSVCDRGRKSLLRKNNAAGG